jgi:hypothetical protein
MNSGGLTAIPNGVSWSDYLAGKSCSKHRVKRMAQILRFLQDTHTHQSVRQPISACVQCLQLMPVPVMIYAYSSL